MSTTVAAVLLLAMVAYAVFGGADFGAGFWDLTAGGTQRGRRPRAAIERSIGPVWEANHVWLIFIFVVLWTSFSEAYASITLTLFVPLTIAALGIVLRGASFAFRKVVATTGQRRILGGAFAISSVLVPYCMGAIAGGIASGRVPAGGQAGDPVDSWINPTSVLGGVLAVAVAAYLSAVYLIWDVRRAEDTEMAAYFRRRAMAAAVAVAVVAAAGVFVLREDARYLFDGLTSRALPLVILSVVCGAGALVLLGPRRRPWRSAARRRRGGQHRELLGRGPVALPAAGEPDDLGGRVTHRHASGRAGRGRAGGGPRAARLRPALHPRPEGPPSGRRCRCQRSAAESLASRAHSSSHRSLTPLPGWSHMREPSPPIKDRGLPARATREEPARRASFAALYDVAITDSSYRLQRHEAHHQALRRTEGRRRPRINQPGRAKRDRVAGRGRWI